MDSSDIRVDITLRLKATLTPDQTQNILQALSALDGVGSMRLSDASGELLRISFDPYRLSARDILKWFAQQTIPADLLNNDNVIPHRRTPRTPG